ncbi:MAG: DUF4124 domain-containing protein [Acidiferrobacterales bacterium]
MRASILVMALVIGALSPMVHGVKLYKWVDEEGNVTYQDTPPPPHSAARVEEKHIDLDKNVTEFVLPEPSPSSNNQVPAEAGAGGRGSSGGSTTIEKRTIIVGDRPLLRERRSGVAPTPRPHPLPARPARPSGPQGAGVPRTPRR